MILSLAANTFLASRWFLSYRELLNICSAHIDEITRLVSTLNMRSMISIISMAAAPAFCPIVRFCSFMSHLFLVELIGETPYFTELPRTSSIIAFCSRIVQSDNISNCFDVTS